MEKKIYEKVKDYIYHNDKLFEFLEAKITDVGEGMAEVEMEVKEKHLNAAKICQGGVVFTLADLAFALASNSYGTLALGINAHITYIKPAKLGEKLVAHAQEFHKGKILGTYHITISKKDTGEKIAFFEGMVYRSDELILKD